MTEDFDNQENNQKHPARLLAQQKTPDDVFDFFCLYARKRTNHSFCREILGRLNATLCGVSDLEKEKIFKKLFGFFGRKSKSSFLYSFLTDAYQQIYGFRDFLKSEVSSAAGRNDVSRMISNDLLDIMRDFTLQHDAYVNFLGLGDYKKFCGDLGVDFYECARKAFASVSWEMNGALLLLKDENYDARFFEDNDNFLKKILREAADHFSCIVNQLPREKLQQKDGEFLYEAVWASGVTEDDERRKVARILSKYVDILSVLTPERSQPTAMIFFLMGAVESGLVDASNQDALYNQVRSLYSSKSMRKKMTTALAEFRDAGKSLRPAFLAWWDSMEMKDFLRAELLPEGREDTLAGKPKRARVM